MKKNIILLILGLTITCSAIAETTIPWTKEGCESVQGTWITAHSSTDAGCDSNHCNGMNFCRSNVGMNWWSALTWCKGIGRELADLNHVCPNGLPTMTCANLKGLGVGSAWNTAMYNGQVYLLNGDGIQRWWGSAPGDTRHKALCE